MGLRIYHNGDTRNGNPHWHLWFQQDGNVWGEVLCYEFAREAKEKLNESEAKIIFETADAMNGRFPLRQLQTDDICIKRTEQGKELYWYAIPYEAQAEESVVAF